MTPNKYNILKINLLLVNNRVIYTKTYIRTRNLFKKESAAYYSVKLQLYQGIEDNTVFSNNSTIRRPCTDLTRVSRELCL